MIAGTGFYQPAYVVDAPNETAPPDPETGSRRWCVIWFGLHPSNMARASSESCLGRRALRQEPPIALNVGAECRYAVRGVVCSSLAPGALRRALSCHSIRQRSPLHGDLFRFPDATSEADDLMEAYRTLHVVRCRPHKAEFFYSDETLRDAWVPHLFKRFGHRVYVHVPVEQNRFALRRCPSTWKWSETGQGAHPLRGSRSS